MSRKKLLMDSARTGQSDRGHTLEAMLLSDLVQDLREFLLLVGLLVAVGAECAELLAGLEAGLELRER